MPKVIAPPGIAPGIAPATSAKTPDPRPQAPPSSPAIRRVTIEVELYAGPLTDAGGAALDADGCGRFHAENVAFTTVDGLPAAEAMLRARKALELRMPPAPPGVSRRQPTRLDVIRHLAALLAAKL